MGIICEELRASAKGWRATVILTCAWCGNEFDRGYRISKRRASRRQYCSAACQAAEHAKPDKACETCGTMFTPRSVAKTRFCSVRCNTVGIGHILSKEVIEKRIAGSIKASREGRIRRLKGADNPAWQGGPKASIKRRIASGKAAASLRAYREANPDKVKEFSQRRKGRKLGKLPRGTIPAIRTAQRNLCAICRTSLRRGSHIDHIVALARGGEHVGANIQLLCPPCNLAKSNRDPIDHMRSLGRLL